MGPKALVNLPNLWSFRKLNVGLQSSKPTEGSYLLIRGNTSLLIRNGMRINIVRGGGGGGGGSPRKSSPNHVMDVANWGHRHSN